MNTKNEKQRNLFGDVLLPAIRGFLSRLFSLLSYSVFSPRSHRLNQTVNRSEAESGNSGSTKWYLPNRAFLRRLGYEITMRILALPIVILFFVAAIVYMGTRPTAAEISLYPDSLGLLYKNISFTSEDGTILLGWFIPSLKADDILAEGDKALTRKRPGVVLCHDFGANRDQLLALASTLNREGIEVLLFDFRGSGLSEGKPRSFGLYEQEDVTAAVHYLAEQPTVDSSKISVIGQGLGGIAAIGAASRDHGICSLVVGDVDRNFEAAVSRKLRQSGALGEACSSAFVWGCKTYLRANDTQMSTVHKATLLSENQSLMLVYHKNNDKLTHSAQIIKKNTDARTETLVVESLKPCLLTEYDTVIPRIIEFLQKSWQ